ncbi:MAG TPA: hypothetical protein VMM17_10600, partial [Gemmatimonadaceae bacterium]|nr:hypothetical protein [Gemmatimonadaceae bacterium]
MRELDYPALYADVGAVSARGQRIYVLLAAAYLISLLAASAVSAYPVSIDHAATKNVVAAFA